MHLARDYPGEGEGEKAKSMAVIVVIFICRASMDYQSFVTKHKTPKVNFF